MFDDRHYFLHIGVIKSGTTALQMSVFPRCEELTYFGKPFPRLSAFIRAVNAHDEAAWERDLPAFAEEMRLYFDLARDRVLLSEEEFSAGGGRTDFADRDTIAKRLHQVFPKATVFVVVRDQLAALQSLYCYAMAVPDDRFVPFNTWIEGLPAISKNGRGLELFKYAELVRVYADLFGKERVKVLFYEDMAKRYDTFARELAAVLGVDADKFASIPVERHNVRPSARKLRALDVSRRFPLVPALIDRLPPAASARIFSWIERGAPPNVTYSPENERRVRDYYAADNRAFEAWLGVSLGDRGYDRGRKAERRDHE